MLLAAPPRVALPDWIASQTRAFVHQAVDSVDAVVPGAGPIIGAAVLLLVVLGIVWRSTR